MQNKLTVILLAVVGFMLFVLAVLYVIQPAKDLPSFIPGFSPNVSRHHYTHAVGAFILALGIFAAIWFQTGKKSDQEKK